MRFLHGSSHYRTWLSISALTIALSTAGSFAIPAATVTPPTHTKTESGPGVTAESGSSAESAGAASESTPGTTATQLQRRLVPDATSNNYAGKKAEPIFRVRTEKPQVALSFDAGSTKGQAALIMDILEKYNLKSTFFLTADWMRQNPEDTKTIVARGHEIGNHSVSHPSFPKLSKAHMLTQLQETHQVAKDLTDVDMCLFRFPYGDYSNAAVDAVKECGYYGIQWSVDSIDWRNEGRQIIIDRVLNHKNLGSGSIVLMHMAATYTPSALEEIIQGIQAKGYEIVPVSELIYENNYHMDAAGNQIPN
ncbi:MAG: polysaccharide deacetylase family protein [Lachnospiraceae bacterium]|nr:polysaccharide deacetylase family protein [Lachnospiraceae bacterium]